MTAFPPPNVYFNGIIYDSDYFTHSLSGLTLSQANAKYLQKTVQDTASALETFTSGVKTDLIKSNGGFGGTIYTDPGPTQTYTTLVCQNNSTCSFGGSSGTCNLGGLSSGVNIGFNMPTGQITIATAGTQDTNIAIATRGVYPVGTNKILIGASANTTTLSSGTTSIISATINLATTADSAISIGNSAAQSSNILIGTKAAFISGTNKIVIGASTNTVSLSGGTINVNTPLSPGYSYPITTNTQIGYTESPTITWATTGLTTMATSTILPIGNYVMTFSISTNGPYTGNLVYFASNVVSAELDAYRMGWTASGPYNCVSGSYTFCNTVDRNIQLMNLIGNAQTFAFGAWNIFRIS